MGFSPDLVNLILIFSIFAMSLNLLMGYTGQISIAHAAFGAVGGYSAAYLSATQGWAFLPATAAGVLAAGLVGTAVAIPALRLSGEYLILLTLAVATVIISLINTSRELGGTYGLRGVDRMEIGPWAPTSTIALVPFLALFALLTLFVCWRFGHSAFGRVLKGIREDEMAVRSLGKNVFAYKVIVFGATSAMAGLGGALLVFYNQLASPGFFSIEQSIIIITMFVVGGVANLLGSVLGAALVLWLSPFLREVLHMQPFEGAVVSIILYGIILVLLMRFRPSGLLPERFSPWQRQVNTHVGDPDGPTASGDEVGSSARAVETTDVGPSPTVDGNGSGDDAVLVVRGLRKSFGGIAAVRGVDLELPRGKITGLIGPNGAGKSTLFGLFTKFISSDEGEVFLNGKSLAGLRPDQIARLGMVRSFQDVKLIARMTVLENVQMAVPGQPGERAFDLFTRPGRVHQVDRSSQSEAMHYLEFVGMGHRAADLARDLSYAEQKLVGIARVIATGADVLLLDEPTSGIDPSWVDRIAGTIRDLPKLDKTVCIVEHNLHFLSKLDARCYFLETGAITTDGELSDLMGDQRLRKAYFGV